MGLRGSGVEREGIIREQRWDWLQCRKRESGKYRLGERYCRKRGKGVEEGS